MACISADGTLTASARKILETLNNPATPEEVVHATGLPLFKVRSGLREMAQAGLVVEKEGRYFLTEAGRQRL